MSDAGWTNGALTYRTGPYWYKEAQWRLELAELRLLVRRCLRACPLAGIAQAQFNLSRTNSAQSLCPVFLFSLPTCSSLRHRRHSSSD